MAGYCHDDDEEDEQSDVEVGAGEWTLSLPPREGSYLRADFRRPFFTRSCRGVYALEICVRSFGIPVER